MADADLLVKLGEHIRVLRTGCGWTQQQLADAVGLARTSITNIEKGRQGDIGITLVVKLAAVLGVGVAELVDRVSSGNPWLDLARAVTDAERDHRRQSAACWDGHDVAGAIKARYMADGLELARELHLRVVAGTRGEQP